MLVINKTAHTYHLRHAIYARVYHVDEDSKLPTPHVESIFTRSQFNYVFLTMKTKSFSTKILSASQSPDVSTLTPQLPQLIQQQSTRVYLLRHII